MQAEPAKLRDFAVRYTAAWCSQDAASVAAFYSPGGSLTVNRGAPAVGRSEITELAQSFMTAFPDLQLLMDELLVRVDCAEYHWTLIGTNTGPGGTGQRVRINGFELWQIGTDGLIAASQGQFDAADYRRQLEHGVQEPQ
jgi:SnoaL-like polyketide cyclase